MRRTRCEHGRACGRERPHDLLSCQVCPFFTDAQMPISNDVPLTLRVLGEMSVYAPSDDITRLLCSIEVWLSPARI